MPSVSQYFSPGDCMGVCPLIAASPRKPLRARLSWRWIGFLITLAQDRCAFVVMPNHVHLLMTPLVDVSGTMQSLKRFTARECNRVLGLTGHTFWQSESYDRLVRDGTEFQRIVRYIETNPVKAGLVATPEEFSWSSARPIANRPQVSNLPHKRTEFF